MLAHKQTQQKSLMKAVGTAAHTILYFVLSKSSSDMVAARTCAYVERMYTGGQTCLTDQLCCVCESTVWSTAGVGAR